MLFHCLTYRTSRLMPMCTVTIFAISGNLEYFREIMPDFFFLHIERSESFDSRSIDNISIPVYREHFREGSRVHTFVVVGRNLTGLYFSSRQYSIDECRFSNSRMTGEKSDLTFQVFLDSIHSGPVLGRNLETRITDMRIQINKSIQITELILVISIYLIKYQFDRYTICFGRSEKTVDKNGGCFGIVDSNH